MNMIAVIGQGFVGGSLTTVFSERGQNVAVYDKTGKVAPGGMGEFFIEKTKKVSPSSLSQFIECVESTDEFQSIYFVCLPTPMRHDGSCDTSIVESVLDELSLNNNTSISRIAVIKSTIPPGTTERWNKKYNNRSLNVVFSPEFLTEANALDDMRNQDRIIIGGPHNALDRVGNIFNDAFPNVPLYKTTSTTAEMVKYVANCFLATKVSFANEMYQACKALFDLGHDVSYNSVIELARLDKRLGNSHWQVPGPMPADDTGLPAFGFSGSCVPGDTIILLSDSSTISIEKAFELNESLNVESCNFNVKIRETKNIEKITKRKYIGKVYKFSVGGKEIISTPEHIFPIVRNNEIILSRASEILNTDKLFLLQ